MSTRAMAQHYANLGGRGINPSAPGLLDVIANLTGQNDISGGMSVDPTTGKVSFKGFQGSSGMLGGRSRRHAAELNAQVGTDVMQMQHETELQEIIQKHQVEFQKLKAQLDKELENNKQLAGIASNLGVPVEKLKGALSDKLYLNALREQQLRGKSLATPEAEASAKIGTNLKLAGMSAKDISASAPSGGVSVAPNVPGINYTKVAGATPRQTYTESGGFTDPKTGMHIPGKPVVTSEYEPANVEIPRNPRLKALNQGTGRFPSSEPIDEMGNDPMAMRQPSNTNPTYPVNQMNSVMPSDEPPSPMIKNAASNPFISASPAGVNIDWQQLLPYLRPFSF